MLETDIFTYFAFGYNYNLLRNSAIGWQIKGEDSIEFHLKEFFDRLNALNLQVTKKAASDLFRIYTEVLEMKGGETEVVDSEFAKRISSACQKFDATLDAELQLRAAFIVTPKRFDLANLLETPEKLLGEEARARLSSIARFDFASACKAIAFALPTAAAFHLMRCVEAMFRDYYCHIIKRNRVKGLMWNNMLTHLRKRQDTPPKALLDHLDNIRTNFRNPTQHPDARFELEEAQDLLSVSIDALNRMARDLARREKLNKSTG
jgi:hypothetical protein